MLLYLLFVKAHKNSWLIYYINIPKVMKAFAKQLTAVMSKLGIYQMALHYPAVVTGDCNDGIGGMTSSCKCSKYICPVSLLSASTSHYLTSQHFYFISKLLHTYPDDHLKVTLAANVLVLLFLSQFTSCNLILEILSYPEITRWSSWESLLIIPQRLTEADIGKGFLQHPCEGDGQFKNVIK